MTENEAIEWQEAFRKTYNNFPKESSEACDVAITALKEIQQYKKTNLTPTMIEDLKKSEKQAHKIAMEQAMKLEEYEALGTVEEIETYIRLAEKLNVCDLVKENAMIYNRLKFVEMKLQEVTEKQQEKYVKYCFE